MLSKPMSTVPFACQVDLPRHILEHWGRFVILENTRKLFQTQVESAEISRPKGNTVRLPEVASRISRKSQCAKCSEEMLCVLMACWEWWHDGFCFSGVAFCNMKNSHSCSIHPTSSSLHSPKINPASLVFLEQVVLIARKKGRRLHSWKAVQL